MTAPKGNKLWQLRKSHGRKRKFSKPSDLWNAAVAYFEWIEKNPLHEQVLVTHRGSYRRVKLNKMRAMTQRSLCLHLGITIQNYSQYRQRPEFDEVCGRIDAIMFDQKFTGAAAGLLNPVIIARDLGLKEQKEISGPDGGPIETAVLDKDDYAEIRKQVIEEDDC